MLNTKNMLLFFVLLFFSDEYALGRNLILTDSLSFVAMRSDNKEDTHINPLSIYSKEWNETKYQSLNTAKDAVYMSQSEREVIWILNLIRYDPLLFLKTVLLNPESKYFVTLSNRSQYYLSLVSDLKKLKSNKVPLAPNPQAFESAKCHAIESGKTGYVGHQRKSVSCKSYFRGECCQYGSSDPLKIILDLLIDENVPSLGHREICLSPNYLSVGVSIQPHNTFGFNAVLDFY